MMIYDSATTDRENNYGRRNDIIIESWPSFGRKSMSVGGHSDHTQPKSLSEN